MCLKHKHEGRCEIREVNGGYSCQHIEYFYPKKNQTRVDGDEELKCQKCKDLVKCKECRFWVPTDQATEVDVNNRAVQDSTGYLLDGLAMQVYIRQGRL